MRFRFAAIAPLVLAACSPLDPLPTDSEAPVPATSVPVAPAVNYGGYRVTEPADWRGVNEAQTGN